MNIKRSVGARVVGFSHKDNLLKSLEESIISSSPDSGIILDVGCGNMNISSPIADRLGTEYQLIASDINPKKLSDPDTDAFIPQPNLIPITGDATRLPFKKDTFDVTYSTSFFSHVHSHEKALDEQIRVLKPNGALIIIDENLLSPYQLYKWLTAIGPSWIFNQDETSELEVKGFKYKGKNENHYSPIYWKDYISARDDLRLVKISSPRVEQDELLSNVPFSSKFSNLYTLYETHTIIVAQVNK